MKHKKNELPKIFVSWLALYNWVKLENPEQLETATVKISTDIARAENENNVCSYEFDTTYLLKKALSELETKTYSVEELRLINQCILATNIGFNPDQAKLQEKVSKNIYSAQLLKSNLSKLL